MLIFSADIISYMLNTQQCENMNVNPPRGRASCVIISPMMELDGKLRPLETTQPVHDAASSLCLSINLMRT